MNGAMKAFTLIELMVVMIIVGILASVSLPMMSSSRTRATLTEVVTALSYIRTAEIAYYTEYGKYLEADYEHITDIPSISAGDLNGKYSAEGDYRVDVTGANPPKFYAYYKSGSGSGSGCSMLPFPGRYMRMDEHGAIQSRNIPGSGYPEY